MDSVFIVGKKWDPGILDPGRFSAQIRKVEARLGKLAKIRKVETDYESSSKRLGKSDVCQQLVNIFWYWIYSANNWGIIF